MNIKKQLRCFFAFEALLSFRITDVVWVLFLLDRGYNLAQIGIAEGIFHITSLICEVPSGMMADIFDRKRTLIFSGIAGIVSSLFMGFGDHILFIFIGMLFSAVAISMASGTEEALVYDSMLETKQEFLFKKMRSRMSVISRVCSTLACLFSPIAIFMGYQQVYLLCAMLSALQILFLLGLKEPTINKISEVSPLLLQRSLTDRWKNHIQDTFCFIRKHPRIICKLLTSAAIASPCYLTLMYLQNHLVVCGWPESYIGIPMFVIPMGGTIGAWLAAKGKFKLWQAAFICGLIGGVGTIFAGSTFIVFAILGAMVARFGEGYFEIVVSDNTNKDFPSAQRASLISIDGMLYSVLMIILSPITGILGEQYSVQTIFLFLGGSLLILTALGTAAYLLNKRIR